MKNKGFTLVELLAVIVILAAILAIAIPSISNVISSSTKSSFESDAKMVLKAADYKRLEDSSFKEADVDQNSINELLGLSNNNYSFLKIIVKDNLPIITIIGKNKWNGLIACGSYTNIKIVEDENDCGPDLVPPVITLNGGSTITIGEGEIYSDMGATAIDNRDGDITSKMVVTGSVNTSVPGTYTLTYTITDAEGNASTLTRTVNVTRNHAGPNFIASKGVNGPNLAQGMVPVKWDGTEWVDTTVFDADWYNYDTTDKKWANARTADGSMWVWIPRYIYKISSGWHTSTAGTIDVQFSKGTDDNWNSSSIGSIDTGTTSNASNKKWTNHPGFNFGSTKLTGIWIAKFEPSVSNQNDACYTSESTANCNKTTLVPKIIPNAKSWRSITIGNAFTVSLNMRTNAIYGWGTSGNGIDTHMMKNTEWGAVSYLSKSDYGQGANEIWINPADDYTTGCAGDIVSSASTIGCLNAYNTANGVKSSTTGTIYGIYDMSGGAWEYVSAYVDNGNSSLTNNGNSIVVANDKYKDVYAKGATDDQSSNYALAINQKGDAVYETSTGSTSWFGDYSAMPYANSPWFNRGGKSNNGSGAGVFSFHIYVGGAKSDNGFRPVLAVSAGL